MAAPISAKSASWRARGADVGAEVEHDAVAVHRRPLAGDGRAARCPAWCVRISLAIAIKAPVLPAETMKSASRFLHRLERQPHARAAPAAHGLARLVLHFDDGVGVHDARPLGEQRMLLRDAA